MKEREKEEAAKLYRMGMNITAAARQAGVTKITLLSHLRKTGQYEPTAQAIKASQRMKAIWSQEKEAS